MRRKQRMKGLLRHSEGVYPLSCKPSYVGRDGCDINLQSPHVDSRHALLEYNEEEGCFILQDLNSSQGTYVNECRIQNAVIRLAPFDSIKFGFNGPSYQFEQEEMPAPQRPLWTAHARGNPYNPPAERGLPYLGHSVSSAGSMPVQPAWMQLPPSGVSALPFSSVHHNVAARARPATAGSWRAVTFADARSSSPTARNVWSGTQQLIAASESITNQSAGSLDSALTPNVLPPDSKGSWLAVPRNERLGLTNLDAELEMKDQLIEQLTAELMRMRQKLHHSQLTSAGQEVTKKVQTLEEELVTKQNEIITLKDQVLRLGKEQEKSAVAVAQNAVGGKMQEICDLRNELERVRKDKNITSGLVTQMQRDMASKDVTISRLAREIEALKKEVRDRDVQIATTNARAMRVKQTTNGDNYEQDQREKDVMSLKTQLKSAEGKLQNQTDISGTLKSELDRARQSLAELQEERKKLRAEADQSKAEFIDMQRTERMVRVDLEQALRKHERLHSRVVQVAYSTPGAERPSHEVKDDELMTALHRTIDERSEMLRQISDLKDKLKAANDSDARSSNSFRRLKEHIATAEERLQSSGLLAVCVKQEMTLLQTVSADGSDSVQTTKGQLLSVLTLQLNWQQDIESALERAGIHSKLSRDATSKHIDDLHGRWQQALKDKMVAEGRQRAHESQHRAELEGLRLSARQVLADRIADAVEKVKLESEDRLSRATDEIKQAEEEKHEQAIEAERKRAEELENAALELRQSLLEQQAAERERMESAMETARKLEDMARAEEDTKQKLQELESLKDAEIKALVEQIEEAKRGQSEETRCYKEQNKQHSLTISTMEERLAKASKKNKDLAAEIGSLKQSIKELKTKPKVVIPKEAPAPKTQVVIHKDPAIEVSGLNQVIVALRAECTDCKKKMQDQQDVIAGLRRDLTGVSARLQDTTGELSEAQKQDLERNRALVTQKERQIMEMQQQMAKLSHIIDKQAKDIKELETGASKLKSELLRYRSEASEKGSALQCLEQKLEQTKTAEQEHAKALEEESRIASELTSLGAACRGERHQQVLERQREALAELRRRVKELETQRPPSASGASMQQADSALQQAVVLKREIAEMRTSHSLEERSRHDISSMAAVERAVSKARGIKSAADAEAEHERSAHRQTNEALEESEKSYLALLRSVASALGLGEVVQGVHSLAHVPSDERQRLVNERDRLTITMADKVRAMTERMSRKDHLLNDYERDLAKLRQAETLVEKKSQQVDALADEVQRKLDEAMYLRESLGRTKEQLSQEKRLNTAIKQKKTYHLENEGGPFASSRAHNCLPQEDLVAKETARKKKQVEKLKKKNYEIRSLKEEVSRRDQELYHVSTRLLNFESAQEEEGDAEVSTLPKRSVVFA